MNRSLSTIIFSLLLYANAFAQTSKTSKFSGTWANAQYQYYKNDSKSNKVLYSISPWFIIVDSLGKCRVTLLYEQRQDLGYPVERKSGNGVLKYHYKTKYDTWLYSVKGNDSLMVYSNGITPGAGIIFKKYDPAIDDVIK